MRVVWTPSAISRLEEIQDYIAQDSPQSAYRVAVEITSRTEATLSNSPFAGRVGHSSGTREFVLRGVPYIVVYQVTQDVEVLDVWHMSRQWPASFGD